MRALGLTAAVATVLLACGRERDTAGETDQASATECIQGPARLDAGGVGPLRVGQSIAAVEERCAVTDTIVTLGEGIAEPARVVRLDGASVLALTEGRDGNTVSRIIVNDRSVRTERGIGIGSSVGDLRSAYGRVCPIMGEGRIVASAAGFPGVSFELSTRPSSLPRGGADIERTPERVPDSDTVIRLWVHGGADLCGGS